jgi:CheY-like chemotaxis protein
MSFLIYVHKCTDRTALNVLVSRWEPSGAPSGTGGGRPDPEPTPTNGVIMEPAPLGLPDDVLIVEDDPIIALDFEDTILGFGVKAVRCAGSVAHALMMIEERVPDFALLDIGLAREKSFDVAERLAKLNVPFAFVTGYGGDRLGLPFADRLRLPKPCSSEALLAVLRRFAKASRSER